jgi:hypothetical protein
MIFKHPRRAPIAATVGAMLAALGMASGASGATIYSCVKKKSGTTRIVSAKTKCKRSERRLSWSVAGPVGERGASGAPGPAGGSGPSGGTGTAGAVAGYSVTSSTFTSIAGETPIISTTIPAGSYIVTAKITVAAMSAAAGWAAAECALVDTPGPEFHKGSPPIDFGAFEGTLSKGPSSGFGAAGGVPFATALNTTEQSTLTILCAGAGGGTEPVSVAAGFSSIAAVQTSHNS